MEADGAVDAQNAPTAPWKTLCVFHELPQGLSHQVTHEKLRKAPKYRWEIRIDPFFRLRVAPVSLRRHGSGRPRAPAVATSVARGAAAVAVADGRRAALTAPPAPVCQTDRPRGAYR